MIIGYQDHYNEATLSDITGSGGFEVGAPLENVQDRRLAIKARRNTTGGFSIRSIFTEKKNIGIVSLLGHNFNQTSTITVDLFATSVATTPIATMTVGPLPIISDAFDFPNHTHIIFDRIYSAVKIEISVTTSVGYPLEVGRIWSGPYFKPARTTVVRDFEIQCLDNSVLNSSLNNQIYADYRGKTRRINCTLAPLTEQETIGISDSLSGQLPNMMDVAFTSGRAGNVIVIPVTTAGSSGTNNQVIHRFGVYGHFVEPPIIRYLSSDSARNRTYTSTFQVEEEL